MGILGACRQTWGLTAATAAECMLTEPSPACLACSGLTEGLGVSIESLVGRSPLRDIVVRSCKVQGQRQGVAGLWVCVMLELGACLPAAGPSLRPAHAALLRVCSTAPPSCVGRPQDPDADIRQSGFALVGDLAKACAPHIKPALVRSCWRGRPRLPALQTFYLCGGWAWMGLDEHLREVIRMGAAW